MKAEELIAQVSEYAGLARFVGCTYRAKESGELARHTLIIGSSYLSCIEDSLLALSLEKFTKPIELIAAEELRLSFENTIERAKQGLHNDAYTKAETYVTLLPGIKVHREDSSLELGGLQHAKVVLEQGTFKTVKSSEKTLEKARIRRMLPVGRWRTLALDVGCIESVRLNGETLEFP